MSILIGILTVIEVIVCLLLILLILMQRPRQEGLGAAFGGGVTDQMFGAQTTNVLQKSTGYLAGGLFVLTLILAVLTTKVQREKMAEGKKLFQAPPPAAAPATPDAKTPAPGAPTTAVTPPAEAPPAGKTVSVTKQPGATVVVKQPDGKAAPKTDAKPDAKPASTPAAKPASTSAPAAAQPAQPAKPAAAPTTPAPKPAAAPAAASTPPPAPAAPAKP